MEFWKHLDYMSYHQLFKEDLLHKLSNFISCFCTNQTAQDAMGPMMQWSPSEGTYKMWRIKHRQSTLSDHTKFSENLSERGTGTASDSMVTSYTYSPPRNWNQAKNDISTTRTMQFKINLSFLRAAQFCGLSRECHGSNWGTALGYGIRTSVRSLSADRSWCYRKVPPVLGRGCGTEEGPTRKSPLPKTRARALHEYPVPLCLHMFTQ
jgi:hypothetical protein